MIVPMKKITLLMADRHKTDNLQQLRSLGVVHIKHLRKPSSDNLRITDESISLIQNALDILRQYETKEVLRKIDWCESEVSQKVKEIISSAQKRDATRKDLQDIESELIWYKPWGGFDPAHLDELKIKGIFVKLYKALRSAKKHLKARNGVEIISEDKQYVYFAHMTADKEEKLEYEIQKLPQTGFDTLIEQKEKLSKSLGSVEALLKKDAPAAGCLKQHLQALNKRHNFLNVMEGMKKEEGFSYLQGFIPKEKIKAVTAFASDNGTGYLIEEPENLDEVPTLIKNPKWIDIIRPVFKFMNTVPGYEEYDISLVFLLFFSVFFAMLIGDAGYGLIFLAVTFLLRRKFKNVPVQPFALMYVLSAVTVCWGAITGTWFGAEQIAQIPFFNSLLIGKIDSFAGNNQNFMIFICFTIGIIHLSIAHLMRFVRMINSLKALAEIGWILVLWGLYFLAGKLVISRPLPGFAVYLLSGGAVLLVLFSNAQKNILKGIAVSAADIPLKIISSFADVVSYLRLFAVGYASVVLASTFNSMAANLGFNSVFTGLISALILFLGHGLNIVLGFMAVIVHGIRLNLLEFSGQMGMEWSGKEYSPFKE
jgi:V/A-type H+-transporting ATPase subunit I